MRRAPLGMRGAARVTLRVTAFHAALAMLEAHGCCAGSGVCLHAKPARPGCRERGCDVRRGRIPRGFGARLALRMSSAPHGAAGCAGICSRAWRPRRVCAARRRSSKRHSSKNNSRLAAQLTLNAGNHLHGIWSRGIINRSARDSHARPDTGMNRKVAAQGREFSGTSPQDRTTGIRAGALASGWYASA